jgi:hypothetical protein
MNLNPVHLCCAARIAPGDLIEIDRQLSEAGELNAHWLLLVKQCLVAVANLADLERLVRFIYKTNPEVSSAYKVHRKAFEFAKYVRNIMVGHLDAALLAKAMEWKPELNWLLVEDNDKTTFLLNLFVLETALNTYVDGNEMHLLFDGDTDLSYPPDWKRFLVWLSEITHGGISFLEALVTALQAQLPTPPSRNGPEAMMLFAMAGQTVFKRVTKSGQSAR